MACLWNLFAQQDYHVLRPLPSFLQDHLAETKVCGKKRFRLGVNTAKAILLLFYHPKMGQTKKL